MDSVMAFGSELLRTGDLDPVYVAIAKAGLDHRTRSRLCLAYWCFYHLGAAARIAEAKTEKDYWDLMWEAARYSPVNNAGERPWPRGAERRHYRGEQAVRSMFELMEMYTRQGAGSRANIGGGAEGFMRSVFEDGPKPPYSHVAKCVQMHRGFGEWIAFKIADMGERVLDYDVDFSDCHLGIYKDPRQGAALVHHIGSHHLGTNVEDRLWERPITDDELRITVDRLVKEFRDKSFKALGTRSRLVNVQEIETVLCKYKSHVKGHYPLGKDTIEVGHGLEGWGDLAQQLRKGMPTWPPKK